MIRSVPDEVYAALKMEARGKGVSAEALVRTILERHLLPEQRLKMGGELARLGQLVGGMECQMLLREQRLPRLMQARLRQTRLMQARLRQNRPMGEAPAA